MKRIIFTTLCSISLLAAADNSVLLRNAAVHPVSGPDLARAGILVQNGKIAEVGAKVSAPRGVRVLDLKGLHVYPGMIDSATQIGLSEISAVRETNDTDELGDFNPQLRALIAVNPASQHIPVARANGITSVITMPAGGIVSGQAALMHLDGWTWEEMGIKTDAAIHMNFPTVERGRSRYSRTSGPPKPFKEREQAYKEKLQQLGEFFEQARRYQQAKAVAGQAFKTDPKLEAMLNVIAGKTPLMVQAIRRREIRAALDFAEKEKVRIILSQPRQVDEFLTEIKEKDIPIVLGPTLALPLEEDDPYDSIFTTPARLHEAGIRFAFGSFFTSRVRNLPYEASAAVGFGLPKEAALKAVTLGAAEIWGVADQVGSIEGGKIADLIVTDGDPLETRTQIKYVFIEGRQIDPNANHQYEQYEKYSARP